MNETVIFENTQLLQDFEDFFAVYKDALDNYGRGLDGKEVKDACVERASRLFGPTSFTTMVMNALLTDEENSRQQETGFLQGCIDMVRETGSAGWLFRMIYVSCTTSYNIDPGNAEGAGHDDGLLVPLVASGEYSAEYADDVCRMAAHIILAYGTRTFLTQKTAADLLNGKFEDALDSLENEAGVYIDMSTVFPKDMAADSDQNPEAVSSVSDTDAFPPENIPRVPITGINSLGMLDDNDDEEIPRQIQDVYAGISDQDPEVYSSADDSIGQDGKVYPSEPENSSAQDLPYSEAIPFYLYTLDQVRDHINVIYGASENIPQRKRGSGNPCTPGRQTLADNLEKVVYDLEHNWDNQDYTVSQLSTLIGYRMAGMVVNDKDDGPASLMQALDVCEQNIRSEGVLAIPFLLVEAARQIAASQFSDEEGAEYLRSVSLGCADAAGVLLTWVTDPADAMRWALLILDGDLDKYDQELHSISQSIQATSLRDMR